MTDQNRNKAFLFILLAAVGVLLLAAGLPGMQLVDGLPFPAAAEWQPPQPKAAVQVNSPAETSPTLWIRGVLACGLLLLLGCVVFVIRVPRYRMWIRPILIALAILALAVIFAAFLPPMQGAAPAIPPEQIYTAPAATVNTSPLGGPPVWLLWLVGVGLLLLVIFFCVWLFRQAFPHDPSASPLVQEAESALAAIQAGTELSGVIVRCYLRMNQAILEERGMARDETLTPREFETFMAEKGVPAEPLQTLTRLFEAVRYGHKPVNQQAESTAVACLTAIIHYCQSGAARP